MAGRDAEVRIGGDASGLARVADDVKAMLRGIGKVASDDLGRSVQKVGSDLVSSAVAMSTSWMAAGSQVIDTVNRISDETLSANFKVKSMSFEEASQSNERMRATITETAIAAGGDLDAVMGRIDEMGGKFDEIADKEFVRPEDVAKVSRALGEMTGDVGGAVAAYRGLQEEARLTGRSANQLLPLAVTLHNVGKVAGDTRDVLGTIRAQAEKVGTAGGAKALEDQYTASSGALSRFASQGEKDVTRVTAFMAKLGEGLGREQASRVAQGAVGAVASDPRRWERYLHRGLTDEKGQIREDPATILRDIVARTERERGPEEARRVLMQSGNLGPELGARLHEMYRANGFKEIDRLADAGPSRKGSEVGEVFAATPEGQRFLNERETEKKRIEEARRAQGTRDYMASHPFLGEVAPTLAKVMAMSPAGDLPRQALNAYTSERSQVEASARIERARDRLHQASPAARPGASAEMKGIEDAVVRGIDRGFTRKSFNVVNATGGPVEVSEQGSASAAAGNQGR